MKQKQKGSKKKGSCWDQVPIGEEFLGDKEMENLISLEVMTDYDLVKKGDIVEIVSGKEKDHGEKKKRSIQEIEEDGFVEKVAVKKKKVKNEESVVATSHWEVLDPPQESAEFKTKKNKGHQVVEIEAKVSSKNLNQPKPKLKKNAKKGKRENEAEKEETNCDVTVNDQATLELVDNSMDEWIKAGVNEPILGALKEAKFYNPTLIQSLTLPASILGKKDIVGAAETGSGKTLAFAIPIIHGILQDQCSNHNETLDALILTPTRELAVQIKKHFDVAAKYTNIKSVVIVGGLASQKQERLLRSKPQVVIATPGRLWELVKEGNPHLSSFDKIKYLAIDETDRMVERGHFQELEGILGLLNLNQEDKEGRQNFVFSATLAFTHDPPKRLHSKKMKQQPKKINTKEKLKQIMDLVGVRSNPKVVDITSSKGTCETLQEMQINCPSNKKDYYMYYFLIKHPGRTIVFCNSINTVRRLTNLFFLLKCGQVLPLHSEMQQKMRLRNLEKFAADKKSVLIATDVAARGLDIVDIQHVVHYEIPKTAESYIHRSGRTARAFKGGIAIVLVEPSEIGKLKNIFRSLNRDPDKMLPLFSIDGEVFRRLKARVDEADKVEQFEHTVRKKLADMNWMDKAKKDMDMLDSEEEIDLDDDSGDGERQNLLQAKKKLQRLKITLGKLLDDNSFMQRLESYKN